MDRRTQRDYPVGSLIFDLRIKLRDLFVKPLLDREPVSIGMGGMLLDQGGDRLETVL